MTKTVKALYFRKRFGYILDEVGIRRHEVIVERAHKPVAVLIPYDTYQKRQGEETERKSRENAAVAVAEWRKKYGHLYHGVDTVKEVRKLRSGK